MIPKKMRFLNMCQCPYFCWSKLRQMGKNKLSQTTLWYALQRNKLNSLRCNLNGDGIPLIIQTGLG